MKNITFQNLEVRLTSHCVGTWRFCLPWNSTQSHSKTERRRRPAEIRIRWGDIGVYLEALSEEKHKGGGFFLVWGNIMITVVTYLNHDIHMKVGTCREKKKPECMLPSEAELKILENLSLDFVSFHEQLYEQMLATVLLSIQLWSSHHHCRERQQVHSTNHWSPHHQDHISPQNHHSISSAFFIEIIELQKYPNSQFVVPFSYANKSKKICSEFLESLFPWRESAAPNGDYYRLENEARWEKTCSVRCESFSGIVLWVTPHCTCAGRGR